MSKQNHAPEEEKHLAKLIDLLSSFFHQKVDPASAEFKAALDAKVEAKAEDLKTKHKQRSFRLPSFAEWFAVPKYRLAFAGTLAAMVLIAGGVVILRDSNVVQQIQNTVVNTFSTTPVYANAEINLVKEGDTDKGVALTGGFTLVSKAALDPESFTASIELTPPTQGTYAWAEDGKSVTFAPTDKLQAGTRYAVKLADTAADATGKAFGEEMQWVFQTVPVFAITGTTPTAMSTTAPRETTVEIEFNWWGLSAEDFGQYFTLTPETAGHLETIENKIVFLPDQPLKPEVIYHAVVRAGFANGAGQQLDAETAWDFRTQITRYQGDSFVAEPWFDFSLRNAGIKSVIEGMPVTIGGEASNFAAGSTLNMTLYETNVESLLASRVFGQGLITPARAPGDEALSEIKAWSTDIASLVTSGSVGSTNSRNIEIELPDLERGIYFLRASNEQLENDRFLYIVVSDMGIQQVGPQVGAYEDGYLWLVDYKTMGVKAGETARFYTLEGEVKEINARPSDDKGLIKLSSLEGVHAVVAGSSVLVLTDSYAPYTDDSSDWNDYFRYNSYVNDTTSFRAVIATDRPLYRPADEIQYKVSIRERQSQGYAVPGNEEQFVVMLKANGETLYEQSIESLNAFGSYAGVINLPTQVVSDWNSGLRVYRKQGEALALIGSYALTIADYRKPDFELSLELSKAELKSGEPVEGVANLKYFFGEPIVDKRVTYRVYQQPYFEPRPGQQVYEYDGYYGGVEIASGEGQTDAAGKFHFAVNTTLANDGQSRLYSVQVSYIDDLQVTNVASDNMIIHTSDIKLFGDSDSYSYKVGDKVDLNLTAFDVMTDAPKSPKSAVSIVVWRTWYERLVTNTTVYNPATKTQEVRQRVNYTSHTDQLSTSQVSMNASGEGGFTFTPSLPGSYELKLSTTGENGRIAIASHSLWISDNYPERWWGDDNTDIVQLTSDKDKYDLNEQALFTVSRADTRGAALVIVQQESFKRIEVFDLSGGAVEFSQAVDATMTPNFDVTVYTPSANGYNGIESTSVQPRVDMEYQRLNVKMSPNQISFLPAGTLELELNVSDATDQGIESESVVYLVDKALLALKPNHAADWFEELYKPRYYYSQSASSVSDKYGFSSSGAEGGGGGGDATLPRTDLKDSAAFTAFAQTDADGKANLSLPLPHNLTTWVVVAQTITKDGKVGLSTEEIIVSKDLIVRPSLPTSFLVGDTFTLSTVVHNFSDQEQGINFELAGSGFDVVTQPGTGFQLAAGADITVDGTIKIQDVPTAQITVKAFTEGDALIDQVTHDVPIFAATTQRITPIVGKVSKADSFQLQYEGSGDIRDGVELTIRPSLVDSFAYTWAHINEPAYGTTPELVERILTNTTILNNQDILSTWASREAILESIQNDTTRLEQLLQKNFYNTAELLQEYESDDLVIEEFRDGWGYSTYDATSVTLTAWAYLALAEASKFSDALNLNSEVMGYAAQILALQQGRDTVSLDDKALIAYALARGGKDNLVQTQALAEQANHMLSGSVATLALALGELGDTQRGRNLVLGLSDRVKTEDTLNYLEDMAEGHQQPQTVVFQTSQVIAAASQLGVKNDQIENMARWLDQARQNYSWYHLYDQAQTLRSLLGYYRSTTLATPNFEYALDWNGEEIGRGVVEQGQLVTGESTLHIPADKLRPGSNDLVMRSNNDGTLFLGGETVAWSDKALDTKHRISFDRRYLNRDGNEQTTFKRGDLVLVEYRYDGSGLEDSAFSSTSYDMTDYLPTGLEFINTSFENVSEYERDQRWDAQDSIPYEQRMWVWPNVLNNQLSMNYWHWIPNVQEFSRYPKLYRVLVRAAFTGEFGARPAAMQSQNIPSAVDYTDTQTITITNE